MIILKLAFAENRKQAKNIWSKARVEINEPWDASDGARLKKSNPDYPRLKGELLEREDFIRSIHL